MQWNHCNPAALLYLFTNTLNSLLWVRDKTKVLIRSEAVEFQNSKSFECDEINQIIHKSFL